MYTLLVDNRPVAFFGTFNAVWKAAVALHNQGATNYTITFNA